MIATFSPPAEPPYTLIELLGMRELNPELARFTYANEFTTLGRYLFDTAGITEAFKDLIVLSTIEQPQKFMSERGNEACVWRPRAYREDCIDEQFQKKLSDEVTVSFRNFSGEIPCPDTKKPWHALMQEQFLPLAKNALFRGSVLYDYGTGQRSNVILTEFKKEQGKEKNWQIFAPFFDNALMAYSSFVNGHLRISAWNYTGHSTFQRYGHTNFGVWKGTLKDFISTAGILEQAFKKIHPASTKGPSGEVKLFHDDLGMICMRTEGQRYEALHPSFYLRAHPRFVHAPSTMIFGKHAFEALVKDFNR